MRNFLNWLDELLLQLVYGDKHTQMTLPTTLPSTPPQNAVLSATAPVSDLDVLLDWHTIPGAHHNVRALCDLEGLTYEQKQVLTACVMQESGFYIHAVRHNYAYHADGTKYLASTDNGICQWNDYYHGKEISPSEALNDPEKAVRLMCQYWKQGLMKQWVSYSSGAYKKYLGRV